ISTPLSLRLLFTPLSQTSTRKAQQVTTVWPEDALPTRIGVTTVWQEDALPTWIRWFGCACASRKTRPNKN
ncbi:unnamed protein product, partial [Arabidopsis halleri]